MLETLPHLSSECSWREVQFPYPFSDKETVEEQGSQGTCPQSVVSKGGPGSQYHVCCDIQSYFIKIKDRSKCILKANKKGGGTGVA